MTAEQQTELETLKKQINHEADEVISCDNYAAVKAKDAIRHARDCGKFLVQARSILGEKGGFLTWIKENTKLSQAVAYRYIKIAEHKWKDNEFHGLNNLAAAYRATDQDPHSSKGTKPSRKKVEPTEKKKVVIGNDEPDWLKDAPDHFLAVCTKETKKYYHVNPAKLAVMKPDRKAILFDLLTPLVVWYHQEEASKSTVTVNMGEETPVLA